MKKGDLMTRNSKLVTGPCWSGFAAPNGTLLLQHAGSCAARMALIVVIVIHNPLVVLVLNGPPLRAPLAHAPAMPVVCFANTGGINHARPILTGTSNLTIRTYKGVIFSR